jgi:hypothetical protein
MIRLVVQSLSPKLGQSGAWIRIADMSHPDEGGALSQWRDCFAATTFPPAPRRGSLPPEQSSTPNRADANLRIANG